MTIKKYKKAPSHKRTYHQSVEDDFTFRVQNDPLTLWRLLRGIKNDIKKVLTTSKIIGLVVPLIFIIYGVKLLSSQIIPVVSEKIQKELGHFEQGNVSLINGEQIIYKQKYLSNPGSTYFQELQENAGYAKAIIDDPTSNSYTGTFALSIPSLGLQNLPVQSNVNSGVEEVYDRVLEKGLAHMESTGLPISEINNNIVIYGHSAAGNYFERTKDKAAAFSQLNKIKLGEEIEIQIDGQLHKYKVDKTKIVEPDDIEIISGSNPFMQELTLFTCFPNGNNAQRFVVVATPVSQES